MPELPEIECLKRTLEPVLIGAMVADVRVHRSDVVRCHGSGRSRRAMIRALLRGQRIDRLERHGKQLSVIGDTGSAICIHLGMSGQCRVHDPFGRDSDDDGSIRNGITNGDTASHIHCRWTIHTSLGERELLFRDPRRFGGLWTFPSFEQLHAERWAVLGPDALTITGRRLHQRIAQTQRTIKSALLDQRVIAGVGNIYADEALFAAGIHPMASGRSLSLQESTALARAIRTTLRRAIAGGGSTLRDYRDGAGRAGSYQTRHAVYGRAGQPCMRCGVELVCQPIAQRTTVYCPRCQHSIRTSRTSRRKSIG